MNNPLLTFTASEIAAALGRPRQRIAQLIEKIPPSSHRIVKGNLTCAWHFAALPVALQSDLESRAQNLGYADAHALLSGPAPIWQPPIPLDQVRPEDLARAVKLRAALDAALQFKDDTAITAAERDQAGVAAYQKAFGHAITARHWRTLFFRTIERDGNRCDWSRVEIYLAGDIAPQRQPRPQASTAPLPEDLADVIKTLDNPAKPTASDRKFLFDAAFRHLEDSAADDPASAAAVKSSLLDGLWRAVPALAKTKKAFRKMWHRKHAAWILAGGDPESLSDARQINSGKKRKQDFSADEKKIRDTAILHGGNISLAHRKLRQSGQLSPEYVKHYTFNARQNKSYVPRTVRDGITPEVEMCGPIHRGPWQAKMRGPYIPRDWSAVAPADWFSGDDVTWNNYFYFYDDAGQLHIERGECLVLHDLRTGHVLDYILIAGKYNSRHIRKLILRVHDRHGLPHAGFYFERGVWKARIIRDLDSRENFHWRETESGLAAFGLQVRHATTPRAKTIEGLFRIIQERQRSEPGFVGFNERLEDMERMQAFLARARRGTAKPENELLSMEQWTKRLDAIFSEYNKDVQNGKMLPGASPAEAWHAGLQRKPLRQLPPEDRFLLSTHCTPAKVHQEGIVLKIGGNKMLFYNEHTSRLIGHDVLAFYNLDCPDLLTVSDLKRQNYFTVKSIALPAMTATKEQFAVAESAKAGHRKAAKEIYGSIQRPSAHTIIRDDDVSEETKELGRFVNQEKATFQAEQTATRRTLGKIQIAAASAGLDLAGNIRNPDRVLQGIELERAGRAQLARETDSATEEK